MSAKIAEEGGNSSSFDAFCPRRRPEKIGWNIKVFSNPEMSLKRWGVKCQS